jgi:hypothetical protein
MLKRISIAANDEGTPSFGVPFGYAVIVLFVIRVI